MAKAKTPKPPKPASPIAAPNTKLMDPKALHELLGIPGPYDPPPAPIPTRGYVTWWDPGLSVQTLVAKHRALFHLPQLLDGLRIAKDSDSWEWWQWRVEPIEPGLTFAEQQAKLSTGDDPAAAREVVAYIAMHFLTTGERLDLGRLRYRDVTPTGQRWTVWFSSMGFDLASVPDDWQSPGIGLSVMSTAAVKRK